MRTTGRKLSQTIGGEVVAPFLPEPLPPRKPALAIDDKRAALLARAERNLARLDVAGAMVPSLDWFIYAFVRKEAVITSQIEGTQATLVDLLEYEAEKEVRGPDEEVREICNYLDALTYTRVQLASPKGLPLSMRLLHEAHKRLLRGVRGANKQPGEIRRSQNWIGGARPGNAAYVPPRPEDVPALLGDLEKYLHSNDRLPPLVRIGLAHVQFETIHPYLDGNGRIGRLLVTLLLEHWNLLSAPLLYLSVYFKRHRAEYYRQLTDVRERGSWEAWTDFFLEGVATVADEAVATARDIFALVGADRERVLAASGASVVAVRLLEQLPLRPMITIAGTVKLLETTKPTAAKAVQLLEKVGVLVETSGKRRDRTFAYKKYLDRLRAGTELEPEGPITDPRRSAALHVRGSVSNR